MNVLMVFAAQKRLDEIYITSWEIQQYQSLSALGVNVEKYYLVDRKSIVQLVKNALKIRKKARLENIDLIHVQWGSSASFVVTLFAPVPSIITLHGSDLFGSYTEGGRRKTLTGILSTVFSHLATVFATRCIVVSNQMKDKILKPLRHKCSVIPCGIDLKQFTPMDRLYAREVLKWDRNKPVVVFFSGNAWVKAPDLAFQVIEIAKVYMPDIEFHVVENQPFGKMVFYYNAADAMLMTSIHEGSNVSLKEAIACNLPVVTTDCGDAKERLKNVSPSFICSRNPQELAEKLITILKERKRSNGRQYIEGLSLENMSRRIMKVYNESVC